MLIASEALVSKPSGHFVLLLYSVPASIRFAQHLKNGIIETQGAFVT
jgi:hypothetical protein